MTPNDIEILIHCHVSTSAHPRLDAPAVRDSIETFRRHGLIEPFDMDAGIYQTTERGWKLIEMLCKTPWPVKAWVDPRLDPGSDVRR